MMVFSNGSYQEVNGIHGCVCYFDNDLVLSGIWYGSFPNFTLCLLGWNPSSFVVDDRRHICTADGCN